MARTHLITPITPTKPIMIYENQCENETWCAAALVAARALQRAFATQATRRPIATTCTSMLSTHHAIHNFATTMVGFSNNHAVAALAAATAVKTKLKRLLSAR
jgi:hypothetical protein